MNYNITHRFGLYMYKFDFKKIIIFIITIILVIIEVLSILKKI